MAPRAKSDVAAQIASSPILAVALDTVEGAGELNEALRVTTERILATLPSARLACVNVLKLNRIAIDRTLDEQGSNKHIDRLVALRHWATPLKLDESRLSVHVLEAVDPAAALLEFAEINSGRPRHHRGAAELVPAHAARQRLGQGGLGGGLHRHRGAAAADGCGCGEARTPAWCGAGKDQAAWAAWTERLRRIGQAELRAGLAVIRAAAEVLDDLAAGLAIEEVTRRGCLGHFLQAVRAVRFHRAWSRTEFSMPAR